MSVGAMYPGTFDPVTNGHLNLVRRAARLFDRVVVAVAASPNKTPMFTLEERIDMARVALADAPNITVDGYSGLTVDYVRQHGLRVIIRGLRAVSDFEFEFQLATMNRHLQPDIESVFLTPAEEYTFVSSTFVREIGVLGGDIRPFVPDVVAAALARKRAELAKQ
ncbi:MAG: pantetheine-phosphate adenylyltransferase [Gammaproteobacteria bacterium]|nr:pantetheine-phosphate adenylyltransferase [Gammaproteobacteria bacterium]